MDTFENSCCIECGTEHNAIGLCWDCSKEQGFHENPCPHCGATNPNVDFHKAMQELDINIKAKKYFLAYIL